MKLTIVAYPHVSDDDRRWIEDLRKAHDPQSRLIAAHFTLVFPADVGTGELVAHAESVLAGSPRIAFVLRRARAVRNLVGQRAHVFLVPDRGASEIVRLHDRLYSGFLEPHLRAEMPFIPHMTVAAHRDFRECKRLAVVLNEQGREISGQLTGVDVVEGDAAVRSVAHLEFAGDERCA